ERETTGCETASWLAARAMLPDCATASRTCRSLSLIRRPIRSFQRMGRPLAKLLTRCRRIALFSYVESEHVEIAKCPTVHRCDGGKHERETILAFCRNSRRRRGARMRCVV